MSSGLDQLEHLLAWTADARQVVVRADVLGELGGLGPTDTVLQAWVDMFADDVAALLQPLAKALGGFAEVRMQEVSGWALDDCDIYDGVRFRKPPFTSGRVFHRRGSSELYLVFIT